MIDPNMPLELVNGAGLILEVCFLSLMGHYLVQESSRRGLTFRDWFFRLPPSMHLGVALLVFDTGVVVRTAVVWAWRHLYGAGQFSLSQISWLAIGGLLIVVGTLCKIRSITKPDFGNGPWLAALAAVTLFAAVTLLSA